MGRREVHVPGRGSRKSLPQCPAAMLTGCTGRSGRGQAGWGVVEAVSSGWEEAGRPVGRLGQLSRKSELRWWQGWVMEKRERGTSRTAPRPPDLDELVGHQLRQRNTFTAKGSAQIGRGGRQDAAAERRQHGL